MLCSDNKQEEKKKSREKKQKRIVSLQLMRLGIIFAMHDYENIKEAVVN